MNKQKSIASQRQRRKFSVRKRLRGTPDRPRLSVFRSSCHTACQLIDDSTGTTLASASTRDQDLREQLKSGGNCDAAKLIGQTIAQRALTAGVKSVRLDRGSYKYHGRVAALADAAREAGLEF